MRFLLAIPLLGALLVAAVAGDITTEENPVPANSFAVVRLALDKGDSVIWDISPEPTKLKTVTGADASEIHFNGPAGTVYTVNAFIVNFDAKKFDRKRQMVTMGQAPRPPPIPPGPIPPTPPAPPQPTGAIKRFVVVEDTSKAGTWRGDVLGSPKVASFYKSAGLSHRLVDINADGDDPVATAFKQLGAGKSLPWLWQLDVNGQVLNNLACPTDPDKFVAAFDTHPGKRSLGAKVAPLKAKWKKFGESPATPLIPRANWKPMDLGTFLPPVHDQDGIGQCASSSACTVWESCRNQAGLPYVYASAGDLYSRVNGGRDEGSMPEDNMSELLTNGVAPASMVPYIWDGRQDASAATKTARLPNRLAEAFLCDSFDSLASAIQQGFVVQIAISWFDNFNVDSDGWLPARGTGGDGGHALCAYGLTQRNGIWALKVRNSWGPTWGNSKDGTLGAGNCIIPESLFGGNFGNTWAARAAVQTKSDFPAPKLSLRDPFHSDRWALAP